MIIANNKKAYHEYFIEDTYEAGIVLVGCEVKSVKAGGISLVDSYVSFKDDELFYLMSRGINIEEANYLLIKGFLLNDMDFLSQRIDKICEKFWR